MTLSPLTPPVDDQPTVDDAAAAYGQWREECSAVRDAYDRWSTAARKEAMRAHAAYRAALDREEVAARTYAELIEGTRVAMDAVLD